MDRTESTTRLHEKWCDKHFKYLKKCFITKRSYFEGSFESIKVIKNHIIVNGTSFTETHIKIIIIDYYCKDTNNYYTCFGDVVFMFLTELVEGDVDIFRAIESE
ncbi:MAG: hypothetical protein U9O86_04960 [Campylobacterota bacterium]|nr:hypothetical protein [Campylobacterota bacterium]